jgi:L-lysine exporter family protein LysE/ArgO
MNFFLEGFFLQASLIFALGAQNIYVLETGLIKKHQLAVCLTCFLCDLIIILSGVLGMSLVLDRFPHVKIVLGLVGIILLARYALDKIKTPINGVHLANHGHLTLSRSIWAAIGFSILNPHAYLDGIVLIGGYAFKYPSFSSRLLIGLGASSYSLLWFLFLSYAASSMRYFLTNAQMMKRIMNLAGVVLLVLSFKLSWQVYSWIVFTLGSPNWVVFK